MYFLDPVERRRLVQALREGRSHLMLSLDVGITTVPVALDSATITLSDGTRLPFPPEKLLHTRDDRTILMLSGNTWEKWQYFSEETGRFYKMVYVAPEKPPTVEISGVKMHVTEGGDPELDTRRKLRVLGRLAGPVLDTCCGLGYTAIAAARFPAVTRVVTVEKDPLMRRLCRENPWSRELFAGTKIEVLEGSVIDRVEAFPDRAFAVILHDPPRYSLAPELYEVEFYRRCWRVLQLRGRMYHYTGDPHRGRGKPLAERTLERLRRAGFSRVKRAYQGVVAWK